MKYLFSILFIGMTLVSFAQKPKGHMKGMNDFTPDQNAIIQTKKMALALDLNTTQQNQILQLNKKQAINRKTKMEAHKAMMQSENKPSSDERFKMMNEMLDARLAHQVQVKKILNKDQYAQWKTMQKGKMTKMHKKGKMMHGKNKSSGKNKGNGKGNMKNNN